MRQAQGSLAEGPRAQRRCARSRILPAYVDAPPLPGIPEFQPFALPSEGGSAGAIQGEDGLTMFDAGPPVDPGLFRYDASDSRFEKRGQEDFPDWKRTIEQSRKGFYCYVWRSGYRLQDKLTNQNVCFPDEIKERFKRAPTCALLAHSGDFEQLAKYAWQRGEGKRSAIQEEIDGHDLVIRFKDQSIGDGAFGRKTNYRVYSKVGSGLQRVPHRDRTFEKAMMERRNQNVSDGLVVLWNQDYDKCKDRLEMEAWFAKEAERSGVPLYTFNPDDLRTLVKGWYEFAQHDEAIKDCIWNDRENKDSFCYRVFHRRYPVSTKQGTGCRTPTTGFGGALAFLNVCSTISLYGYSSYPMPPRGDMNYHKTSLAEQTLLLKVLSDSVDGLAKKSDPKNFTQ